MGIVVIPLLIANTEVLEIEWLWMTHIGTYLTPFGINRAIGKLYEVEGILDIRLKFVETSVYAWFGGVRVLELTG